jgi:transcriptional regulator with XRE-family HTH domain
MKYGEEYRSPTRSARLEESKAKRARAQELLAEGLTFEEIGERIGVDKGTVSAWLKGLRPTVVVNLRKESFDVYIGRKGKGYSGYYGNPFRVGSMPIEQVLVRYREYFIKRIASDPEFKSRVLKLRGRRLGCFCVPNPCHGQIIVEWLNSQPQGED